MSQIECLVVILLILVFILIFFQELLCGFDDTNSSFSSMIRKIYIISEKNGTFYAQRQNSFFFFPTVKKSLGFKNIYKSLEEAKNYMNWYIEDEDPIIHKYKRQRPQP